MRVLNLHEWNVSSTEAGRLQRDLAGLVVRSRCLFQPPRYVAGIDLSVDRASGLGRAAVVVLSFPRLELVEVRTVEGALTWPYVPGFLSFREMPLILAAWDLIETAPDLVLVDGHGSAHPRRLGIASHLGLFLDVPTVGCAKSLLCGAHGSLGTERGDTADIIHRDEVVGVAVRTRRGVKPVYVSVGHKCGFADAVESVLHCTGRYRLPEPTRLAHLAAGGRLPR
jgi:deoxyribonuclease V